MDRKILKDCTLHLKLRTEHRTPQSASHTHHCTQHSELSTQHLILIALTDEQVATIRQLVRKWTGIQPQNLLINCSHTHSAPAIGRLKPSSMGIADPVYLDLMVRKAATAVKLACDNLLDAKLFFGTSECRIGINRRQKTQNGRIVIGQNPEGVVDHQVSVLAANLDGRDFWLIAFSYACHPEARMRKFLKSA
jgi:neutral ceramidase